MILNKSDYLIFRLLLIRGSGRYMSDGWCIRIVYNIYYYYDTKLTTDTCVANVRIVPYKSVNSISVIPGLRCPFIISLYLLMISKKYFCLFIFDILIIFISVAKVTLVIDVFCLLITAVLLLST